MSKVIKGGTIVTADREWKADILIEGEQIVKIAADLTGDEVIEITTAMGNILASGLTGHGCRIPPRLPSWGIYLSLIHI